ncbi:MAG: glutamyl-tRNA synthetase [Candidatus Berkelbacteria bacterium Licking1014_2]|uniref:Glutamate--tRNA ligase n=1 Tax=Candidatus Berkelbacteria bacterium Licking1014_2 TaxID=2017146 RepID=A0A554LU64_9BACT|nr:MAG: glutamyl-tRNA synthetase [Candidatus Berkelbacteria bacterium Licking1014_2]
MKDNVKTRLKPTLTRLAPSPTGWLHIGTARTALFNWLYAKHCGGQFFLRIEDTDQERSRETYVRDIIDGLKWLGLDWDGEIIYQHQQLDLYQKYIKKLLDEDAAYKKEGAIYFKVKSQKSKVKSEERIVFDDLIRGEIEVPLDKIDDFVIVKSDGSPLFLLTNIIDDSEMGITVVLRGEDHISNTPKQLLLAAGLGIEPPRYGHLPLILNPDRSKMSKRSEAPTALRDYQKDYLPAAVVNFLALLGWRERNVKGLRLEAEGRKEEEIYSLKDLIKGFDLDGIQKSPAVFDCQKLDWLNAQYIRRSKNYELRIKNKKLWEVIKDRVVKLSDIKKLSAEITNPPDFPAELLIFGKSNKEKTLAGLNAALKILSEMSPPDWESQEKLAAGLTKAVVNNQLSNGDVFWPVRVALSGQKQSPSPPELLWVLGKEEALKRIKKANDKIQNPNDKSISND